MADIKKEEYTTIRISKKLKEKLDSIGKRGQTFEDIVWDIIKKAKL